MRWASVFVMGGWLLGVLFAMSAFLAKDAGVSSGFGEFVLLVISAFAVTFPLDGYYLLTDQDMKPSRKRISVFVISGACAAGVYILVGLVWYFVASSDRIEVQVFTALSVVFSLTVAGMSALLAKQKTRLTLHEDIARASRAAQLSSQ